MKRVVIICLFLLICLVVWAERAMVRIPDPGEEYYKALLQRGVDVDRYYPGHYLDMVLSETDLPLYRLLHPGLMVLQTEAEAKQNLNAKDRDIPGFRTYNMLVQELQALAAQYSTLMQIHNLGPSTGKYYADQGNTAYQAFDHDIWAVKISDNVSLDEDEPQYLFVGAHHAREPLSVESCMAILNHLLGNYGTDDRVNAIVDNCEIWFVPLLNPDGHKIVIDQTDIYWRKNIRDNNNNGILDMYNDGVDLNRNYSYMWGNVMATDLIHDSVYHGPYPFSEIETQALRDLIENKHFLAGISFHSQGQYVLYPPGFVYDVGGPDQGELALLAESMVAGITSYDYTPMPSYSLYPVSGTFDDWFHMMNAAFSYTIELAYTHFPPASSINLIAQSQVEPALRLLERANYKCIHGHVLDAISGEPLEAKIHIEGYDNHIPLRAAMYSRANFGSYHRFLPAGNFRMSVSAPGYQPASLWIAVAEDSLRTVNVRLHPSNIIDTGFWIKDSLGNSLPAAVLEIGSELYESDDEGKIYISGLSNELHQLKVSCPRYSSYFGEFQILPGWNVIRLSEIAGISEGFEETADNWIFTGYWGIVQDQSPQGIHCLSENCQNMSCGPQETSAQYSHPIDLTGASNVNLQFWAKTNIVQNGHYIGLRYREAGETVWHTLMCFMGVTDWEHYDLDFTSLAGSIIELSLCSFTGYGLSEATFWIDDIRLYTESSYSDTEDLLSPPLQIKAAPNPFASELMIGIQGSEKGLLKLDIYNLRGQKVRSMQTNPLTSNAFSLEWDGKDAAGRELAAGLYFLKISAPNREAATKKVIKLH
ncbi:MAG: M14 family zinc carboxypeptidase [Candidatus Cloacimonetes bacterium]|nr:M14 family zinc carboxypeptidase [Candidatus Cloacimonadota bacterium]MDD4560162.1 M14 family zinc carboxypeptidase [Candidatus Cloacimonadota bacterium]